MKTKRKMSRFVLARRLHSIALQISAGKPVRVGDRSIIVPDTVILEEELEMNPGEIDLEFEIHWRPSDELPAKVGRKKRPPRRKS